MPIFQYECLDCEGNFSLWCKELEGDAPQLNCPNCDSDRNACIGFDDESSDRLRFYLLEVSCLEERVRNLENLNDDFEDPTIN